jgi:uncharacterized tellurite resistance protein B-like protein
MRSYRPNSPEASARLLALAMIVDGHLAPAELRVLEDAPAMHDLSIDRTLFGEVLEDLCNDMLHTAVVQQTVELNPALINALLAEITEPELRRALLAAMWKIVDADGVLADAEAVLLSRACAVWAAESRFVRDGATPLHAA